MSAATAVKEEPVVAEPLKIRHLMDKGVLQHMGADLNEPELIEEYYEYRNTFGKPGIMDNATLHRLVVEQKRRQAKKAKGK